MAAGEVAPRVAPIMLLVRDAAVADPDMAALKAEVDGQRLVAPNGTAASSQRRSARPYSPRPRSFRLVDLLRWSLRWRVGGLARRKMTLQTSPEHGSRRQAAV